MRGPESLKLLVDASNLWFRAYAATANAMDQPGGAMLVTANALRTLRERFGASNVVLVWDAGHSGRQFVDSDYKAGRVQIGGVWHDIATMSEFATALGIPYAKTPGFEADDTIASIASQSTEEILILSYDKDFYQLVNDRIKVLHPARKIGKKAFPEEIIDRTAVIGKMGFPPEKLVLFKSFKGDTSDNIPKLPIRFAGDFKKIFAEVVNNSTDVEDFYSRISSFDPKHQEELRAFKARALQNQSLLAAKRELPAEIKTPPFDCEWSRELMDRHQIYAVELSDWVLQK
jgi:DNA polymerase-1